MTAEEDLGTGVGRFRIMVAVMDGGRWSGMVVLPYERWTVVSLLSLSVVVGMSVGCNIFYPKRLDQVE